MAILHPHPVRSDRFTAVAAGLLVADASDLGFPPGGGFERVYDDACDVGFTLVLDRTGQEVVYVVENESRDREGDLLYWELRAADSRLTLAPTIHIFND